MFKNNSRDDFSGWREAFESKNFYSMYNLGLEEGEAAPADAINPYQEAFGVFSKENYDIQIKRLGFSAGFLKRGKL